MDSKRIAVLDLGTNTFHLLIADVADGVVLKEIIKNFIPVKLGEGGINKGHITDEAFDRGIAAVLQFNTIIQQHQTHLVKGVATSAIRDATNGNEFINRIKSESGIEIEIIDGDREAELIYKGVCAAIKLNTNVALIMDIGGGSVEFVLCNSSHIFWKKSYPIGAARLMENYHRSDPISKNDIQTIHQHLNKSLTDLKHQCNIFKPKILIGSAGAFETFAELVTLQYHLPKENLLRSDFNFNKNQLDSTLKMLLESTHKERTLMPGIIPLRIDMIVVAAILTQYIVNVTGIKIIKQSTHALKEGVLLDLLH